MNYILLSLLTLGIWISSASGLPKVETQNQPRTQGTIRVQDRPTFSHNATLHRRNNINKYGGCDKMYKDGKSKGKDIVKQGYHDMLRMTGLLNPFLTVVVDEQLIELDPGPMENRFLAVGKDDKSRAKRDLIYTIIQQSALWYPWYPFDWFGGRRIEVYCEVDQPNTGGSSCAKMENGMKTRAYAVNYKGKSQIVFCASYFIQPSLDERKAELDKTPDKTKDLTWMRTRAHTFFHEMSHLAVIEGRKLHVVKDLNQNPVGPSGKKVYGPKLVEALARDYPDYAYLNADNYAWYATAMWYRQFYGDPDSASITATAPEDDAVDYFEDDGSDPLPAEFDNPDYDEISEAEAIAFAAGDYTPSGWLKNKKLRILPLGDSITSGVQSSDGNGYRKDLLNILEGANNAVEMIGSMKTGNMADNAHEGHNGATIDQIATFTSAYTQRPNVILLHAGTYDLSLSVDPASAPQRLDSLVGKLVAACPDATIIVSRIIPSSNGGTASLIKPFNKAVAEFMAQRADITKWRSNGPLL
ncbi:SGNH hydrolase [Glarea lozoyensis ATCC 20868]|uniref:SGNH hydrolase n=1 Tax=Glarea lozoyensis (strain ATCC 20868 / MF5171) TaxID=1116229 RepID=S3DBH5_GLAL2|nr:SGNH hydrolase [Glarea lozoyensis ATCC 20868]EPE29296.1 SGNH hydrolase [Glarea lozoyensis ATCC 20868]